MEMKVLSFDDVVAEMRKPALAHQKTYLAMYSSVWGGIVRDPCFMTVPIDDHIVHRGDGVFEAIKCTQGAIYGLEPHLERLERSAELISLKLPYSRKELVQIISEAVEFTKTKDVLIRLYVSRGPGGFTTNPYECIGSQLYVVITQLKSPSPQLYEKGATLGISSVEVKPDFFATIKSCNYLPNVLMKKEAVDRKVDFTVSIDRYGFVAEGSTENIGFILPGNRFVVPGFQRTLRGITATRLLELAQKYVQSGELQCAETGDVTLEEARKADEVLMLGTTLDVLPITRVEGAPVGTGEVGRWAQTFLNEIRGDLSAYSYKTSLL